MIARALIPRRARRAQAAGARAVVLVNTDDVLFTLCGDEEDAGDGRG